MQAGQKSSIPHPLPAIGKGHHPAFDKPEFKSPKDLLCQVWLKFAQ